MLRTQAERLSRIMGEAAARRRGGGGDEAAARAGAQERLAALKEQHL